MCLRRRGRLALIQPAKDIPEADASAPLPAASGHEFHRAVPCERHRVKIGGQDGYPQAARPWVRALAGSKLSNRRSKKEVARDLVC